MTYLKQSFLCVLFSFLAFLPSYVHADILNGDQLNRYCRSQNPGDQMLCIVYISGAVDAFTTIELAAEKTSGTPRQICLAEDSGPEDLRDMMVTWLDKPSVNLEYAATLLIWSATIKTHSCGE